MSTKVGADHLYHFTTANALPKILKSKTIWLTDYKYLNDKSEISHPIKIIEDALNEAPIPLAWHNLLSKHIKKLKNDMDYLIRTYIFCCSETYKNLAMWRFYGDGMGFAIGLDIKKINGGNIKDTDFINLRKVEYSEEVFKSGITEELKLAKNIYEARGFKLDYKQTHVYSEQILLTLLSYLTMAKDPSFLAENEYRFFLHDGRLIDQSLENPLGFSFPKERRFSYLAQKKSARLNRIKVLSKPLRKTYKKGVKSLPLPKDIIKEIWIGPLCNPKPIEKELIKILRTNGYNPDEIQIKQFESPYT